MFSADNRPPLGDMLVAAGIVSAKKMDLARRKQRGSRKTLAEVLIGSKYITDRELHVAGQDFLSEDVANLVASAAGEFQFQQGDEVPLRQSLCQHAVVSAEPLILRDAREDPAFRDHPGPRELGVVAYAGIPLITRSGEAIGTLCAVDTRPRLWTQDQIATLSDLAASAVTEAELAARSPA